MEVKALIDKLRRRGWSLRAIARELRLPYRTVQNWAYGVRRPALEDMVEQALAALLERKPPPRRIRGRG